MTQKKSKPELSRVVELDNVRDHTIVNIDIRASREECDALAKRLDILDINDLNAHVTVTIGARKDLFKIEGDIQANLVQECCVTLAPVHEIVNESFAETMTTNAAFLSTKAKDDDGEIDSDEKPVELIEGDQIDLGETVAQWLTLALNPYPRSNTPYYEHVETTAEEVQGSTHMPFKVLEILK